MVRALKEKDFGTKTQNFPKNRQNRNLKIRNGDHARVRCRTRDIDVNTVKYDEYLTK